MDRPKHWPGQSVIALHGVFSSTPSPSPSGSPGRPTRPSPGRPTATLRRGPCISQIRANNNGFQKSGSLDLLDYDGTAVWSTNKTAIHADTAALLDTASLVIMDQGGNRLWSSFNSPTDTLLPSQSMATNTRLVSASAMGLLYSGFYTFYFDSNYTLSLIYNRKK
ncbi:hypothetical protein SEVIR_4G059450v4 [Setaria viridis]